MVSGYLYCVGCGQASCTGCSRCHRILHRHVFGTAQRKRLHIARYWAQEPLYADCATCGTRVVFIVTTIPLPEKRIQEMLGRKLVEKGLTGGSAFYVELPVWLSEITEGLSDPKAEVIVDGLVRDIVTNGRVPKTVLSVLPRCTRSIIAYALASKE